MKSQFFMDELSQEENSADGREALRVVIAYNDLPAARRAMRVLADLDKGLGDAIEFQPLPWPFDLLTEPCWRDAALSDAIAADILIIASSVPGSLPPAVLRWVELTASQKRGTDAAIVALFGSEEAPDGIGSLRLVAVQAAAQGTGLDFFAPAVQSEPVEGSHGIWPQDEIRMLIARELLHSTHPPPHWGINE